MKAIDIEIGGIYLAKVSGRVVPCVVDNIRKSRVTRRTVYDVTNLKTNRRTSFRSAAKFRSKYDQNTGD